jgi:hypothetical protein
MTGKLSKFFSRITSALQSAAVQHPTHFPAISTAEEAEKLGENSGDGEAAKNKIIPPREG